MRKNQENQKYKTIKFTKINETNIMLKNLT